MTCMDTWQRLLADRMDEIIATATNAMLHAYAPYSNFPVGAAVLTANGNIFPGCNVENASFGLTICAERVAFFAAVACGHVDDIVAVAIVSRTDQYCRPCGACRQVIAEFSRLDTPISVISVGNSGDYVIEPITALLPDSFRLL